MSPRWASDPWCDLNTSAPVGIEMYTLSMYNHHVITADNPIFLGIHSKSRFWRVCLKKQTSVLYMWSTRSRLKMNMKVDLDHRPTYNQKWKMCKLLIKW